MAKSACNILNDKALLKHCEPQSNNGELSLTMKGSRHCHLNFNTSTGLPFTVVSSGLKITITENWSVA